MTGERLDQLQATAERASPETCWEIVCQTPRGSRERVRGNMALVLVHRDELLELVDLARRGLEGRVVP